MFGLSIVTLSSPSLLLILIIILSGRERERFEGEILKEMEGGRERD